MNRAPLRFIFAGRSDGVGSAPTAKQMQREKVGKTTQFYQEVTLDEAKSKDWRKKLATMLIDKVKQDMESAGEAWNLEEDPSMMFMLHDFPSGYRLFEHHTVHEGDTVRDRRDTYLYGHPGGQKKRFRTPKEFFLHLWWLETDPDGDPDNCSCKLCVSDELHREVTEYVDGAPAVPNLSKKLETVEVPKRPAATPPVALTSATPAATATITTKEIAPAPPAASPPARPSSNIGVTKAATRPTSAGRSAPQSRLAPSTVPDPRSQEQVDDAAMGGFLFRVGELVWFSKGHAYGLGIIFNRRRIAQPVSPDSFAYAVQPLSYPGADRELVQISSERMLKPWYAYSPPGPTHKALDRPDILQLPYNRIDWAAALSGRYGPGETEVDASIFAARTVDRSYTPLDQMYTEGSMAFYNGMFIGGEKIWRGDAVRLRSAQQAPPGTSPMPEILIVADITEVVEAMNYPSGRAGPPNTVYLLGDKYTYTSLDIQVPPNEADTAAFLRKKIPTLIPTLPIRVAQDLKNQNTQSVMRNSVANSWRLVATGQKVPLSDIRGRWYESFRMLPLTNERLWQHGVSVGRIPDVGGSLNGRADAGPQTADGSPGFRFADRKAVLGQSVPPSFQLPPNKSLAPPEAPTGGGGIGGGSGGSGSAGGTGYDAFQSQQHNGALPRPQLGQHQQMPGPVSGGQVARNQQQQVPSAPPDLSQFVDVDKMDEDTNGQAFRQAF